MNSQAFRSIWGKDLACLKLPLCSYGKSILLPNSCVLESPLYTPPAYIHAYISCKRQGQTDRDNDRD